VTAATLTVKFELCRSKLTVLMIRLTVAVWLMVNATVNSSPDSKFAVDEAE